MKQLKTLIVQLLVTTGLFAQTFDVSTTAEFRTALQNAAGNGEDDTIILADGTYMTTDDSQGTFEYFDNEVYDLTLIGSSSKDVILSGAEQDQIFNHKSIDGANLKVEKLTFMDGGPVLDSYDRPTNNGGGFETLKAVVDVIDCNFTNNHAKNGGGFYAASVADSLSGFHVINTTFENNSAWAAEHVHGGGFYTSTGDLFVTDSTFIDNQSYTVSSGYRSHGGGFSHTGGRTTVDNSKFIHNVSHSGGGFWGYGANVNHSTFTDNIAYYISNEAYHGDGGGFHSNASLVENSTFHNNTAGYGGGGFNGGITMLINSTLIGNKTLHLGDVAYSGGAGFKSNNTFVLNSVIKENNSSSHAGGISMFDGVIVNSIISNNLAHYKGGAITAKKLDLSNNMITNNTSGIYFYIPSTIEEPNIIKNNIFLENYVVDVSPEPRSDISGVADAIVTLYNNYVDHSNVHVQNFSRNNIFTDISLGFADISNENYHLTATSDLIDAGSNEFADNFRVNPVDYGLSSYYGFPNIVIDYLAKDYEDNNRSVGASMDIGLYEYTTSKPTIVSFTYSGTAQQYQELTFEVNYTLSPTKWIVNVEYDYMNDGNFESSNTHIFNEIKTYTVNAKVTDSSGEFSVTTLRVAISELPFSDMTDEQKLLDATNPLYYNDIVSIFNASVDTGMQYVVDNPAEFNLYNQTDLNTEIQTSIDVCIADPASCNIQPKVVVIPM